jgi:hypothetical protein
MIINQEAYKVGLKIFRDDHRIKIDQQLISFDECKSNLHLRYKSESRATGV